MQAQSDGTVPLTIVSAYVHDIGCFPLLHTKSTGKEDLIVTAQLCAVGRSSMDVLCTLATEKGDLVSQAHYVLAARCPLTYAAAPVIKLNPTSKEEHFNFDRSQQLLQVYI